MAAPKSNPAPRWLLLIHQLPPRPHYLRVKTGRHLQRIGALALKNTVYALPAGESAREDFEWVRREVAAGGGEATICDASFVEGITDSEIEARFSAARDADYAGVAKAARELERRVPVKKNPSGEQRRAALAEEAARLERQLGEIAALDFFGAPGREPAAGLVRALQARLAASPEPAPAAAGPLNAKSYQGKTWVTRAGVFVDRIASAWLIRRFLDPKARFKFVADPKAVPRRGEIRFDMFEAEFTHVGERCTFEVMIERFSLSAPGLAPLAEVVHDIDLKDEKYRRVETPGVAALLAGLALRERGDAARLEAGFQLFDDLQAHFTHPRRGK